ncbi:unnamed protein product [Clonostachys solani]|uniref:Transcription elongation factor 1 homolog n=1 Tax=Clonostachys solani TaxID=160281 RepID=A0A9N9ZDE0_9HYPO|nr:unnamed protein product [Clonostachys solani]
MGKRKKSSRGPQGPKRADPLPTVFTCLFCNHESSVTVKLDKKAGVGQLDCRVCGQKFQCAVNCTFAVAFTESITDVVFFCVDLSAAVDVYGEWVDAADAVAKEDSSAQGYAGTARPPGRRLTSKAAAGDDDDDRYDGEGIVGDDEI